MFARKTNFDSRYFSGSLGLKLAKTFNSVVSVVRSLRFSEYLAGPEKCFAGSALEAFDVDLAPVEHLRVFIREIVSNNADQMHRREKAGRDGKIRRRAAESAIDFSVRAFDAIKCHRTYDE